MKTFRTTILCSTILPGLFMSGILQVQGAVAAPDARMMQARMVLAQANQPQSEEEKRRQPQPQHEPQREPRHEQQPGNPARPVPEHANPQQHAPEPRAPEPRAPEPRAPEQHAPAAPVQREAPRPAAPVQHEAPRPAAPVQHEAPRPNAPEQPQTRHEPAPGTPVAPKAPEAPRPPVAPAAPPAPVQHAPAQPPAAPQPNRIEPNRAEPNPQHTPGQPLRAPEPNARQPNAPQPNAPIPNAQQPNAHQPPPQPGAPQPGAARPQPGAPQGNQGPSTMAPPTPPQVPQRQGETRNDPKRKGLTPLEAGAIGAAVGVVGGMIIGEQVHGLNEVQQQRRTTEGNGATFYSEPGRVIVREGNGLYVRHDETERFREFGHDVRVEQRGDETYQTVERPDGSRIITITTRDGELIRRIRRAPDGKEFVLINNSAGPRPRHFADEVIDVPPPRIEIPQDRYVVDAGDSEETTIYETLTAPPVSRLSRHYTLDEIRYSNDLRRYMPSVDLNTITFATGSWAIEDNEVGRLKVIADAINRAVKANPDEIFLIEGHTDAVGNDVDNLSLSDRRAQSVATILSRNFNVPPENLTTQGYGSQYLKINTTAAERQNRRVVVRRITPLLANGNQN